MLRKLLMDGQSNQFCDRNLHFCEKISDKSGVIEREDKTILTHAKEAKKVRSPLSCLM